MLGNKPYTFDRVVRIGIGVAIVWGVVWLLAHLSDVLLPFAAAFLGAYLLDPIVVRVQKRVSNRIAAVALTLGAVFLVLVLLCWWLVPMVFREIGHMAKVVHGVTQNSELAQRAKEKLPEDVWAALQDLAQKEDVKEFLKTDSFTSFISFVGRRVLPEAWGFLSGTFGQILFILTGITLFLLYTVFLLMDYQKAKGDWTGLIPPQYREAIVNFLTDADAAMNRYFRAQAVIAMIMSVLFIIGFQLIGLPMAVLLGIFCGMLNMVPYLQVAGIPPAFALSLVHSLESGSSIWMGLLLTMLVFVVVQGVQDTLLTPKIMGDVTGLSPAMILLSLSVWGKLLGMLGLLIAIPMTCLCLAYYRRLIASGSGMDEALEMALGVTAEDDEASASAAPKEPDAG